MAMPLANEKQIAFLESTKDIITRPPLLYCDTVFGQTRRSGRTNAMFLLLQSILREPEMKIVIFVYSKQTIVDFGEIFKTPSRIKGTSCTHYFLNGGIVEIKLIELDSKIELSHIQPVHLVICDGMSKSQIPDARQQYPILVM